MVGLDRRRLAKFASTVPSLWGEIFFLVVRSSKSNGSQQQVFVRKELGATFPSLYDFDLSERIDDKDFFQNNYSTTLLDAIFAGSNIILLLLELVRGEATTHKATID